MLLQIVVSLYFGLLAIADKDKPHHHQGILKVSLNRFFFGPFIYFLSIQAYDGKHIAYTLDIEQTKKLNSGEAVSIVFYNNNHTVYLINYQVTFNERTGKNGRGVCLQDINAPPRICMEKIRDLPNYSKMVPKGKLKSLLKLLKLLNHYIFSQIN